MATGSGRDRDADANKAQVAREVCAASAAFAACPHRRRSPRRPHLVDWYLVLAIGEAASEDAVRRRYRQLALQLHPDKNRHPKAEVAFKLVSENRMRDECRVIDSCLRANNAAARARRRQSFPLFDPYDRCNFPDYPHTRPPLSPLGSAEFCRFQEHLNRNMNQNQRWCRSGGEWPVYQIEHSARF